MDDQSQAPQLSAADQVLASAPHLHTERLQSDFKLRKKPRNYFTIGKVFRAVWSEPAGETSTEVSGSSYTTTRFGETVHTKVRRFVIVREGDTYCCAVPITTHGRRCVAKPGVKKFEHGIIYTGIYQPDPLPSEAPRRGELPMQPIAIRVNTDRPDFKLDGISRIDYGKLYTIEHNIKVQPFGKVHPHSIASLCLQFQTVWMGSPTNSVIAESSTARRSSESTGYRSHNSRDTTQRSDAILRASSHSEVSTLTERQYSSPVRSIIAHLQAREYSDTEIVNYLMRPSQPQFIPTTGIGWESTRPASETTWSSPLALPQCQAVDSVQGGR